MRGAALEFQKVSFGYGEEQLLDNLSFRVQKGEFISILGASGSGKTTLFRLITGLEEPGRGGIAIHGQMHANRFGEVGYMPQQDLLLPWRTIRENGRIPLEIQGTAKKEADAKVDSLLKTFGLAGCGGMYPRELSGGMRQRVSFLRATLSGSNVLLLDEPFSALDAMTKLHMQEWLLQRWEEERQTVLFITHDVSEALFLSDRIMVLGEKPITQLEDVPIPIGRPRKRRDLATKEMVCLQEQLLERFHVDAK
ncbi:ABC transporter ATP-binding protein [Bacillus piscicola]|uniref:ABC transporter ATP-binding protein n=1 Tax=Bacillus piscicola TaxID=1632684 RepID=UPI001F09DFD8|nr:ABC transporter ATP-binding protein [Bacillus piscicola]